MKLIRLAFLTNLLHVVTSYFQFTTKDEAVNKARSLRISFGRQVVTRKVPNTLMKCLQNVVQKRDRKVEGREEDSPCCSFNSIEFYSSVQLISLRSPLKSSLSFVAYCFTLRSATYECTYVRFSFTSVPAPLTGLKESQTRGSGQLRIETIVANQKVVVPSTLVGKIQLNKFKIHGDVAIMKYIYLSFYSSYCEQIPPKKTRLPFTARYFKIYFSRVFSLENGPND